MISARIKKKLRRFFYVIVAAFLLINVIAFFHAYKFTHFDNNNLAKTKSSQKLSFGEKVKIIFFGINNPRPENAIAPSQKFETIKIQSNKTIECWYIKTDSARGTVILFHGYGGQKSTILDKSEVFVDQGYNVLLVDFMGSGGSEGNQTTIGFKEAVEVKDCFEYLQNKGEKNIFLFGTSMGAVAILKAIDEYRIDPKGIIIECPFGSMYKTTCARFKALHVPCFPMAGLLVFWGGIQNGFWAFGHQPTEYAKSVACPVLLMYGGRDEKVTREEIDEIYTNFKSDKTLKLYPNAGHDNYLKKYKQEWFEDIHSFLKRNDN